MLPTRLLLTLSLTIGLCQCAVVEAPMLSAVVVADVETDDVLHCGKEVVIVTEVAPDKGYCLAWTLGNIPGKAPAIDWSGLGADRKADWRKFLNAVAPALFSGSYSAERSEDLERYAFVGGIVNLKTMKFHRLPAEDHEEWYPHRNRREIVWSQERDGVAYVAVTWGTHYDTVIARLITCKPKGISETEISIPHGFISKKGVELPCVHLNFERFDLGKNRLEGSTHAWNPGAPIESQIHADSFCAFGLKNGSLVEQGPLTESE